MRLILFIRVVAGGRRRVVGFWEADGSGRHREIVRWNAASDTFEAAGELHKPSEMDRYEGFIRGLVDAGDVETEAVMSRVSRFYEGGW